MPISAGRSWIGLGVTCFAGAVLSAIAYVRGMPEVHDVPQLDKVLHFALAGTVAFFLDGVLRRRTVRLANVNVPLAAILVIVPCAIEEYLQRYFPLRTSSLGDFSADVAGVVAFLWWTSRASNRETKSPPGEPDRRSD